MGPRPKGWFDFIILFYPFFIVFFPPLLHSHETWRPADGATDTGHPLHPPFPPIAAHFHVTWAHQSASGTGQPGHTGEAGGGQRCPISPPKKQEPGISEPSAFPTARGGVLPHGLSPLHPCAPPALKVGSASLSPRSSSLLAHRDPREPLPRGLPKSFLLLSLRA